MDIKFYLKRPGGSTETVIFASISFDGKRLKYYTNEKVLPRDWNFTAKQPKSRELQADLNNIKSKIGTIYYAFKAAQGNAEPSTKKLTELLDRHFKKHKVNESKDSFWGYFENFLERSQTGSRLHFNRDTPLAPKTIANYNNLKRHLLEYQEFAKAKLDFPSFDLDFHKRFSSYLTNVKGQKTNTRGKLITLLKVVLKEALDDGKNTHTVFQSRKFRSFSVETEAVYLTNEELEEWSILDLGGDRKLEKVRDLFIAGTLLGQRFSDVSGLEVDKESLTSEFIRLKQKKTGTVVNIPLRRVVKQILVKYDYRLPKYSNQKFNEYLKDVAARCPLLQKTVKIKDVIDGKTKEVRVPKFTLVTSHTMRRSFATNEYLSGELNISQIKTITGHSSDKSFYKYIRMTKDENLEAISNIYKARDAKSTQLFTSKLKAV